MLTYQKRRDTSETHSLGPMRIIIFLRFFLCDLTSTALYRLKPVQNVNVIEPNNPVKTTTTDRPIYPLESQELKWYTKPIRTKAIESAQSRRGIRQLPSVRDKSCQYQCAIRANSTMLHSLNSLSRLCHLTYWQIRPSGFLLFPVAFFLSLTVINGHKMSIIRDINGQDLSLKTPNHPRPDPFLDHPLRNDSQFTQDYVRFIFLPNLTKHPHPTKNQKQTP